jgi:hypothetical protein
MRSAHYGMTGLALLILGFGAIIGCSSNPSSPAPASIGPKTIYANGVTDVTCSYFTATDGTSSAPLTMAASGFGGYGTDTKSFSCVFFNLSGTNPYSEFGMSNSSPVSSLEGYKTCTFYAQAQTNTNSTPVTVGFNAATPGGGTPDNLIVNEVLTSSWAPYTITITDGARTDGYTGPGTLAVTQNYFVEKLTVVPSGGFPVTVYFDDVVLH